MSRAARAENQNTVGRLWRMSERIRHDRIAGRAVPQNAEKSTKRTKDVDSLVGNFPAQDEPKSASQMLFLMNRPATDGTESSIPFCLH